MSKFNLNSVVLTSRDVIFEHMPILVVFRDNDDSGIEWQFFHSADEDCVEEKLTLVSLQQIIDLDNTVTKLQNLPLGYVAQRNSINDEWAYFPQ
ncbi:TPA: DUF2185 domain-containing protein [Pasteurella multocida]|nr:Uncharacterised protein [Pasteurella multocida]HDR1023043.1 DUF2185 domain-containing protein [Pasteurella multocida]